MSELYSALATENTVTKLQKRRAANFSV